MSNIDPEFDPSRHFRTYKGPESSPTWAHPPGDINLLNAELERERAERYFNEAQKLIRLGLEALRRAERYEEMYESP
jgi:hypothetical protein